MDKRLVKLVLLHLKLPTLSLMLEELEDAYERHSKQSDCPVETLNEIKMGIELVKWQIETIL